MASKNLVFILNLHCPYIKVGQNDSTAYEAESSLVYQQISNVFLPALDLLSFIKENKLKAKIALVFSATLCEILADSDIKKKYNKWLDNLIEFGQKEIERNKKDSAALKVAEENLKVANNNKEKYNKLWNCDLIKAFSAFANEGYAEILATCGSYLFMPHFSDMAEILNAQVESGLYAIKQYFGRVSDGFFLPEMGYAPGIENVIKSYGLSYTILPAQSFLFSEVAPDNGIFMNARCPNGLSIFASDEFSPEEIINDECLDSSKDLAWELSPKALTPFIKEGHARTKTSWSYQNRSGGNYSKKAAMQKMQEAAKNYAAEKSEMLKKAQIFLGDDTDVSLCLVFNSVELASSWREFFDWLQFLLSASLEEGIEISVPYDLLEGKFKAQKITPYPGAFSEFSYGENFISSKNSWMIRYLRKASERIVDLVSRFPGDGGLKTRLLNLAARELLLVQDCSLAKMVDKNDYSDYATEFFKRGIVSFSNVFDALGSNTVSTEWFCSLEKLHPVMPWLNYRIFSKKK
ncbi:MAG: DUF1957 domain-containing protein [Clostridiales bacterium]|nr:DUF1957 domain-containing protein [Clostridiales bacterium]